MPNTLWTVACGGTLHGRRYLGGIPHSRYRCFHCRFGLSRQKVEKNDPSGTRFKNTNNLAIKTFTAIFIASIISIIKKNKSAVWISIFFENKEATITVIIIIKRRRRKRKWTTVTASSSLSSFIIVHRTGKKSIIIATTEIASRAAGTSAVSSYSSPGKRKEETETAGEEEAEEEKDSAFLLVVSSSLSSSLTLLSLSSLTPVIIFATIGFRGDRVFSKDSLKTSPSSSSPSSLSSSTSSLVGWNPRHFHNTTGDDDNNNNKIFSLVIKFKLRLLLLSSPSSSLPPSARSRPYYIIVIVVYFIAVPALKQKIRERIHTDNNINKNHNVTVILYHNWFLSIGMPRKKTSTTHNLN